jgi:hypothetical protein
MSTKLLVNMMAQAAVWFFAMDVCELAAYADDSLSCRLSVYITHPERTPLAQTGDFDSLAFEILDLMTRERHTLRDSCLLPDSLALLYGYRANVWNGVAALAALRRIMKWGNGSYTLQTLEQAIDRLREAEVIAGIAAPEEADFLHEFNETLFELYEGTKRENGVGIEPRQMSKPPEPELHQFLQKALPRMLRDMPQNSTTTSPEHTLFHWLLDKLRQQ